MLARRSEAEDHAPAPTDLSTLRHRARALRRKPAAVEVVWALRHLGSLRQLDWSEASRDPRLIAILDRAFAGVYDRYFRMEVRESTRPFSDRYRVQLHGHKGFVRLALANDVPVVPFVTIGSHATMPMPPGMHALATVTGARRYLGLDAVPLPLQLLAWILGAIALDEGVISSSTFLVVLLATPPLYPSKMTTVFGPPILPEELRAGCPDEDPSDAGYRHVEAVMQGMMDELAAERRTGFS